VAGLVPFFRYRFIDDLLDLMGTPSGKAALSGCHTLTSTVRLVREVPNDASHAGCPVDRSARGGRDHLPSQSIGSRTQDALACQVLLCGAH
jgi:hypothetical protein